MDTINSEETKSTPSVLFDPIINDFILLENLGLKI